MSKNRLVVIVAACILCGAAGVQANDGSIAVYLDDSGTQCEGNINGGFAAGSIYINLAGATADGITGVEFRVDSTDPAAYSILSTPSPDAAAVIGDPFATTQFNRGTNLAFPTCQTGTRVKLFSLLIQEQVHTADVTLTVRQRTEPADPAYTCAVAFLCDAPVYTAVCISAPNSDHWRAVINPSDGISGDCQPVAVAPTTWSQVKSLYLR